MQTTGNTQDNKIKKINWLTQQEKEFREFGSRRELEQANKMSNHLLEEIEVFSFRHI